LTASCPVVTDADEKVAGTPLDRKKWRISESEGRNS
jgi:hypothetical protein